MDKPAPFSQPQITGKPTDSQTVQLVVPGMGSNHCSGLITASIERLPGIININTNIANHRVTVKFDAGQLSDGEIRVTKQAKKGIKHRRNYQKRH